MIPNSRGRDRAVSPVVGKALEATVVVLYIGLVVLVLHAQVVPAYRTTAGDRVADRALSRAAERVQQAVPPDARAVDVRLRVDLPRTIAGDGYTVRTDSRTLVLDHPDRGIGARARLALPDRVVRVEGAWWSRDRTVVRVRSTDAGLVLRLETGGE